MTTVDEQSQTQSDGGASRPLRKDAARNRQLLLDAARTVFAERGLEASLDDIARQAGVGVGTAYRHFANKHELAKAIFTEDVDAIIALAENAAADPDPWTGLVRFIEGTAAAQTCDRGLREVLMGQYSEEDSTRINLAMSAPLNRLVAAAQASGQLRTDAAGSDIGAVVMMLCTVADVFGEYSTDLWRRYLPILLDGLRPGPPLPETPLDDEQVREAFANHKRRLARESQR